MTDSTLSADRKWPYRPDFNQFKRQAKELLKAYRSGDANAVAEVQRARTGSRPGCFRFARRAACARQKLRLPELAEAEKLRPDDPTLLAAARTKVG